MLGIDFRSVVLALLAVHLASSCGEPPVPVGDPGTKPQGSTPAAAHGTAETTTAPGTALFAGKLVLRGALATREEGFLNLSIRPRGGRMPILLRRYTYASPELSDLRDGERVLAFEITERDPMVPGMSVELPPEVELRVLFSPDQYVDARPGTYDAQVPVENGARDIVITLSDS